MDEVRFSAQTTLRRSDYHKFLYIATFFRSKVVWPMLAAMALAGSLMVNLTAQPRGGTGAILGGWLLMFALCVIVVCMRVEGKNRQRVRTDRTRAFESTSTLRFYDDRLELETAEPPSTGILSYDRLYSLMESRDYFIFYLTANQATLLPKRDVADVAALRAFLQTAFAGRYRCLRFA